METYNCSISTAVLKIKQHRPSDQFLICPKLRYIKRYARDNSSTGFEIYLVTFGVTCVQTISPFVRSILPEVHINRAMGLQWTPITFEVSRSVLIRGMTSFVYMLGLFKKCPKSRGGLISGVFTV